MNRKPIYIQNIDLEIMTFPLKNKALQKIAKTRTVLFAASNLPDIYIEELKEKYKNVVILETEKNNEAHKYKAILKWLNENKEWSYVVRTCCDAVVVDYKWLENEVDYMIKREKKVLMGNGDEFSGSYWIRGGCQIWDKEMVEAIYSKWDVNGSLHNGVDQLLSDTCKANGVKLLTKELFEMKDNYKGTRPVWHPPKYGDNRGMAWGRFLTVQKSIRAREELKKSRKPKIAMLTPTHNRPERLKLLMDSIVASRKSHRTKLYLGLDVDDPQREKYLNIIKNYENYDFVVLVDIPKIKPWPGLGVLWNIVAKKAYEDGMDIMAMIGDDMEFKTVGWDKEIEKEYILSANDGWKLVFINDGKKKSKDGIINFINSEYYMATGYYASEAYKVDYHDTHQWFVYKELGRVTVRKDLVCMHHHWTLPEAEIDETTLMMDYQGNKPVSDERWVQEENNRIKEINMIRELYLNE